MPNFEGTCTLKSKMNSPLGIPLGTHLHFFLLETANKFHLSSKLRLHSLKYHSEDPLLIQDASVSEILSADGSEINLEFHPVSSKIKIAKNF